MIDPTVLVLSLAFAAALALFIVAAAVKRRVAPVEEEFPEYPGTGRDAAFDPYRPPADMPAVPPPLPAGTVPGWPYRNFDVLGLAIIFGLFALLVLGAAASGPREGLKLTSGTLVVNIVFQGMMAALAIGAMFWRIRPVEWLGLRWREWPWVFLIAPGAVVAMWVVFGGLHVSGYMKWMESLGSETVQETVKLLQQSTDPVVLGLMAFAAVAVAPVCEEIVFRGYVYPAAKRFAGAWPAAVCSALLFSAAHGNLTALLPLFLFGLLLVFLYEKTGSIWAPMAVHFCFNGATVAAQLAVRYLDIPMEGVKG